MHLNLEDSVTNGGSIHALRKTMQKVTSNPIHILDDDGRLSPSAFVPFCEIGGDISKMSQKIYQFSFPVCNSLKPRVLNDRLCYSLNPNDFIKDPDDIKRGLLLVIDYNMDRQINFMSQNVVGITQGSSITSKATEATDSKDKVSIHLDTLGK